MLHCEMVANAKNVSSEQLEVLFVLRLTSSQVCTTGRRLAFAESARITIFFAEFKPGFFQRQSGDEETWQSRDCELTNTSPN